VSAFDAKGALTPAACEILALNPAERDTLEGALKRAEAEYAAWFKGAVQRVEPAGDVVADYRVPANPEMANLIQAEGGALMLATLGPERAALIPDYAHSWLYHHAGLGTTGLRLTVRRNPEGQQPPLWFQVTSESGNSGAGAVGRENVPEPFRDVFPGGWNDLAQREGFTLPDDSQ